MELTSLLQRLSFNNIKQTGKWVNFSCPVAPYVSAHGFNEDNHPSAGAITSERGEVYWNCFCCGSKGSLQSLLKFIGNKKQIDYSKFIEELDAGVSFPDYDSISYDSLNTSEPLVEIPRFVYDSVFSDLTEPAIKYLTNRGITQDTASKLDLKYSDTHRRIIFPYIRDNKLYGYSGRSILANPKTKILNSVFPKNKIFLGEHLWQHRPTIIVEGLFAYAKLVQLNLDYDIAACSGTTLSSEQLSILYKRDMPIILFLDGDAAGLSATKKNLQLLQYELPTYVVKYSDKTDIDDLTPDEISYMLQEAEIG